ncbi:unnamed protein product [Linum trigynum]|uniref:Uncharacterized protein n=1 Tax=Linum trigynum TaxID=586398 RepID=A0AAV2FYI0_9ROSI
MDSDTITRSASIAVESSELTCLKSMHGIPQPFATTLTGSDNEFSSEPSELVIIAFGSSPPASAALLRMSQCHNNGKHPK